LFGIHASKRHLFCQTITVDNLCCFIKGYGIFLLISKKG
jgi:hypothetical protein